MLVESMSHRGLLRENNEDRFLVRLFENGGGMLAVADGMGGHAAGEVAAELALASIEEMSADIADPSQSLLRSMEKAQKAILEASGCDAGLGGMGTTLTLVAVSQGIAHWAHIGDTRLYLFRAGELRRITDDHTIPGMLFKRGEISKEQARLHPFGNVLLRCVGCEKCTPDTGMFETNAGDLLMVSSDGLHDLIPDGEIAAVLATDRGLGEKLSCMVALCLARGGRDNITAVVAAV